MENGTVYDINQARIYKATKELNLKIDRINALYKLSLNLMKIEKMDAKTREQWCANPYDFTAEKMTESVDLPIPIEKKIDLLGLDLSELQELSQGVPDLEQLAFNRTRFIVRKGVASAIKKQFSIACTSQEQEDRLKLIHDFQKAAEALCVSVPSISLMSMAHGTSRLFRPDPSGTKLLTNPDRLNAIMRQ